jgi:hypothetical protein
MVHVVITEDAAIAADAQARDPGVVAFDLDEPFDRVVEVSVQSCGVRGGVTRKWVTTAPSSRAPTTARREEDHGGHPYKHGPWYVASPAGGAGE